MPIAFITDEEKALPNSTSATSNVFKEIMRVNIRPESDDALIRIRLTPRFFGSSGLRVYYRITRIVPDRVPVNIVDQVEWGGDGPEQIVLFDEPGTTENVTYVLHARGRGGTTTVTSYSPGGSYTERYQCGTNQVPIYLDSTFFGYNDVPKYCTRTVTYPGTTHTSTRSVSSSGRVGLRARAMLCAEQGVDLAVPPLN